LFFNFGGIAKFCQREDVSMKSVVDMRVTLGDGKVQAVQDDCNLLAVLGGKNVVEEGGFACTEVACGSRVSAAVMRFGGKIAHLSQW
jgi:hypothetical protein